MFQYNHAYFYDLLTFHLSLFGHLETKIVSLFSGTLTCSQLQLVAFALSTESCLSILSPNKFTTKILVVYHSLLTALQQEDIIQTKIRQENHIDWI